jgi:hypothetical protein
MTYHKSLADGRWQNMTFLEQMANIGSEVERAIRWKNEGNDAYFNRAVDRMLELIDLTAADPSNRTRLRELMRVRESLVDFLLCDNEYQSTDIMWKKYFTSFNYAARIGR